jgi:hypothetical protein
MMTGTDDIAEQESQPAKMLAGRGQSSEIT